ncbi:putative purine nucleoside [Diplodia seriata]|uniref:Putative purine nucleoside n=1 Tax=Diplodia seriata TaxID=420778 RepID=A0A0G2DRB9_9PEZI|nr:putative purine nucleoside [Diplodia seriata]
MRLCTLSSAAAAFSFFSASVSASPSPSRQDVSQAVAHPAQVDTRDVRTRETEKIKPKVFIVSMFDPEAEVWWGIPEFDLLANNVTVPGFSPLFPEAHCTADGEICQLVTGEGEINAAVTLTALWTSSLFDLTTTYFLIAGIAGISPAAGTLGSVTFARYAVQVALQYEFDAREPSLPANWSTGYVPQGATSPLAYPASLYGTEVFELNAALRDIALAFAQNANVSLADSAAAQTYRAHYATTNTSTTYAPAAAPPAIVACDTATSDVYWSGALLGAAFAAYTRVLTNGTGAYCTTQQEDNASLEALVRGARAGALDVARVVVMRSASDFDRPYPGQGAVENLLFADQGGFEPAVENLYR